ncbi:MAG: hypothetical protein IJ666_03760 [Ruminococcus sp.]|nr:hypothetical protein [Ruminococcus sp.]
MIKKIALILSCIIPAAAFADCGKVQYPDLPENAIVFEMGEYTDKNDDDAMYATIEYNGRIYMPYGTAGGNISEKDIDICIGYIVQEDENDTDIRVYTLKGDSENNYLMDYYIGSDLMNQPSFLRAVDTKGKDILTPEYIDSLDYNFWK